MKTTQELVFSCRTQKQNHLSLYSNNSVVKQVTPEKDFWMLLDIKVDLQDHLNNILNKLIRAIGLLCKL